MTLLKDRLKPALLSIPRTKTVLFILRECNLELHTIFPKQDGYFNSLNITFAKTVERNKLLQNKIMSQSQKLLK